MSGPQSMDEAQRGLKRRKEQIHARNQIIRKLEVENAKLKKEIARINGPFTCKHDPSFVGGACAACHAEALQKISELRQIEKRVEGP